jgi:hypothetical protein
MSAAIAPDPDQGPSLGEPARRCANCGAIAPDAYCPACGQSTRGRLPTFAQFMREATGRYVALDGRLWKSLAALLFRPGFLTREYLAGRRRRYIGPARLFLVSSLVLFAALRLVSESINFENVIRVESDGAPQSGPEPGELVTLDDELNLRIGELPGTAGMLKKPIARFNGLSRTQKLEQILIGALRYGPYAMFALLPAFALLQKMVYLGGRRRHPARPRLYGEHLVFAAHNHAFLFVVGTLLCVVPTGIWRGVMLLWVVAYLARSAHVVYGGSWVGIATRALVLLCTYSVLLVPVTVGLLFAAILLR